MRKLFYLASLLLLVAVARPQSNLDEVGQLITYRVQRIKGAIDSSKYLSKFDLSTEARLLADSPVSATTKTVKGYLLDGGYATVKKTENGGGSIVAILEGFYDSQGEPFAIVEENTGMNKDIYLLNNGNVFMASSQEWMPGKSKYNEGTTLTIDEKTREKVSKSVAELKKMYAVLKSISVIQ